ncbi:hypothetical protein PLESTB_001761100 [Pleodorina starrii]|uniref:ubiquitinyl hydrolase 1 n=1 Tax=Pleodorina starrii TaxID=330485 RepID=A0A9W6BZK7_9CHLO|nr:hypothetical protein PLESTB_001761100 [Pleodorina starrii]
MWTCLWTGNIGEDSQLAACRKVGWREQSWCVDGAYPNCTRNRQGEAPVKDLHPKTSYPDWADPRKIASQAICTAADPMKAVITYLAQLARIVCQCLMLYARLVPWVLASLPVMGTACHLINTTLSKALLPPKKAIPRYTLYVLSLGSAIYPIPMLACITPLAALSAALCAASIILTAGIMWAILTATNLLIPIISQLKTIKQMTTHPCPELVLLCHLINGTRYIAILACLTDPLHFLLHRLQAFEIKILVITALSIKFRTQKHTACLTAAITMLSVMGQIRQNEEAVALLAIALKAGLPTLLKFATTDKIRANPETAKRAAPAKNKGHQCRTGNNARRLKKRHPHNSHRPTRAHPPHGYWDRRKIGGDTPVEQEHQDPMEHGQGAPNPIPWPLPRPSINGSGPIHHEQQRRQFCQVHALNNLIGGHYLNPEHVLEYCIRLDDHLQATNHPSRALWRETFNRHTGAFTTLAINHYLRYNVYLTSQDPTKQFLALRSAPRALSSGNAVRRRALPALPPLAAQYGFVLQMSGRPHAVCVKRIGDTWHLIDSEHVQSKLLKTQVDWQELQGGVQYLDSVDILATTNMANELKEVLPPPGWPAARHPAVRIEEPLGDTPGATAPSDLQQNAPPENLEAGAHTAQIRDAAVNPQIHPIEEPAVLRTYAMAVQRGLPAHATTTVPRQDTWPQTLQANANRPAAALVQPLPADNEMPLAQPHDLTAPNNANIEAPRRTTERCNPAAMQTIQERAGDKIKMGRKRRHKIDDTQTTILEAFQRQKHRRPGTPLEPNYNAEAGQAGTSPQPEQSPLQTTGTTSHRYLHVVTHNVRGLQGHLYDVLCNTLDWRADILVLTETKLGKCGLNGRMKMHFPGYNAWGSTFPNKKNKLGQPAPVRQAGVVIAISDRFASAGSATCEQHPRNLQGYVCHCTVCTPHSTTLHIIGVYTPELTSTRKSIYKYCADVLTHADNHKEHVIIAGDFNAALQAADRSTATLDADDVCHRTFVSENNLKPLTPLIAAEGRQYTYRQFKNGSIAHESRIDDILCNKILTTRLDLYKITSGVSAYETVTVPGGHFDHKPLHGRMPIEAVRLFDCPTSAAHNPNTADTTPTSTKWQTVKLPITKSTLDTVRETLENELASDMAQLHDRLQPALTAVTAALTEEDGTGRSAALRLRELRSHPDVSQTNVTSCAEDLQQILTHALDTLLSHCEHKPPRTGKLHATRVVGRKVKQLHHEHRKVKSELEQIYRRTKELGIEITTYTTDTNPAEMQDTAAGEAVRNTVEPTPENVTALSPNTGGQHVAQPTQNEKDTIRQEPTPAAAQAIGPMEIDDMNDKNTAPSRITTGSPDNAIGTRINGLRKRLREVGQLLRKATSDRKSENIKNAKRRFQRMLAVRPKQGHRVIFNKGEAQQKGIPAIRHPHDGLVRTDPADILDALHTYFSRQAAPAIGARTGKFLPEDVHRQYPWAEAYAPDTFTLHAYDAPGNHALLPHIADPTNFDTCIQFLSRNKAPGPDGIPNELLKALPAPLKCDIHNLLILMWVKAETPLPWTTSDTVLIPKPNGDPLLIKNKRPIALANTLYKLWTSLITLSTSKFAPSADLFSEAQEGFLKHRNTERQILNLLHSIEDAGLTRRDLYILYVDFSSAFNTIDHDKLLQIMYDLGLPLDLIEVVRDLYSQARTCIRTEHGRTPDIHIERGTVQGDTLSPLLFIIFLEPLLRWLHVGGRGYKYGCLTDKDNERYHCSSAAYADDLAAITNTLSDLTTQCEKIGKYAKWAGLEVNHEKCAVSAILHKTCNDNYTYNISDL